MLGLKRGKTKLLPHDPEWAKQFEREKKLLLETFGDKIIAIEHIGSTAIPGIPAKPIIDMNVATSSLDDIDEFIKRLPDLGYEYMPDRRFSDRQFFPKGSESSRTHHLNLVEITSETGWKNPLIFRDYLRNNKEDRSAYARLKTSLAEKHKDNRYEYTERKSDFIREIINKAVAHS